MFQQLEDNDIDVVCEESSGSNQEGENIHFNNDNGMNDVRDHITCTTSQLSGRQYMIKVLDMHNFIIMQSRNDKMFQQLEDNDIDVVCDESSRSNQGKNIHFNDDNVVDDFRNHIARSMKIFIVDCVYANMSGFLEPFHKEEVNVQKEQWNCSLDIHHYVMLLNDANECLRIVFLLKLMPNKNEFAVAYCTIHNFIIMQLRNDTMFQQFEDNLKTMILMWYVKKTCGRINNGKTYISTITML
ncbi:hypothetical protein DVH24_014189 [Malus domestica]|uniref:Uncharacterized protein n=1 Tax=Malus domestica TaxID=3750 RepID=A0A498JIN1_MALDO|nr:hypothetical protein DVH24_014189 [Malus domestica]